jgi:TatD DNase family protein
MSLADTHCHLGRYHDRDAVIDRAAAGDVEVLVATARPSEADALNRALTDRPGVHIGVGFHPEAAGSVYNEHEFATLDAVVDRFAWVSEVGLDRPIADTVGPDFGNQPTFPAQHELLERVLEICGPERGYSVHSRGAVREVVSMLRRFDVERVIMHSFSGEADDLRLALDCGFYISAHPVMLSTPQGRELLRSIPAGRILLETDGPYFTWHQRRIEPGDCASFLRNLGEVRQEPRAKLRDTLSENFWLLADAVRTAHDRKPDAN